MQKLMVEFWKANLSYKHSKNYFVKCFYAIDTVFNLHTSETALQLCQPFYYITTSGASAKLNGQNKRCVV